jgi:hypothetical protein
MSSLLVQPSSDATYDYRYDTNDAKTAYIIYTHLERGNAQWYWTDSIGGTGAETTDHVEANCAAGNACAW